MGLGASVAGCSSAVVSSPDRPPNILFLLTDDQRWDTLGIAGNPVIKTPNMDRLAQRGVHFHNSFVTTSICAVSRASFFTGLYARCHGIHDFQKGLSPDQHAYSYPVRLQKEAGYRIGFIGKYGVGDAKAVEAAGARYDFFRGFPGQGQYIVEGRDHLTKHLGHQAVEFLEGCSPDQPWNLSISFKAPHVQDRVAPYFINDPQYDDLYKGVELGRFEHMDGKYFDSLPDFLKDTENRVRWEQRFSTPEKWEESVKRYYALIYGVDVQIGRLLGELENRGMLDNTVVIFTGDNGFYLGERGFAGKWYMHEESIRTPLIISDPRRPQSHGSRRDEMALHIDICPTILSLANLKPPPSMNGRNLNPLVDGEMTAWRTEWFYEHLFDHPKIPQSEGVRTARWKYFQFTHSDPLYEELYDLAADPNEYKNLATVEAYQGTRETLEARREAWVDNLEAWRMDQPWKEPA